MQAIFIHFLSHTAEHTHERRSTPDFFLYFVCAAAATAALCN